MKRIRTARFSFLLTTLLALSLWLGLYAPVLAADDSQLFPETGKTVSGKFLQYWRSNGGLEAYGFPITDAQNETDPETGKVFLTQWFQRNRFELHPENAGTEYEVLLGLLGKDLRREALNSDPDFVPNQELISPERPKEQQAFFKETGHNLGFNFLDYWQNKGGLKRFGFPISERHQEVDPETGKIFDTQWFERARFEFHPENIGKDDNKYVILLGLLGNQIKAPKSKLDFVWKVGRGYNELKRPTGIAVGVQGNVYVVDFGNNRIQKHDANGQYLRRRGNPGNCAAGCADGDFFGVWGVATDSQGNVYVADRDNHRIQKFDSNLEFLAKWGGEGKGDGQFTSPYGVAVDRQGNVYVGDADTFDNSGRIQKFDSNGKFLTKWGSKGKGDGQFDSPLGLAADGAGNVYVADSGNSRIQKFDSNGTFLTKWGSFGTNDNQFGFPGAIAVDSQNNVWVSDSSANRVSKFDSNGTFLLKWGSFGAADNQFNSPRGLTIDGAGNVYVADFNNRRILKFDGGGKPLTKWGGSGNVDAQPSAPWSVAIDNQGFVYVTDTAKDFIQKFDSSGRYIKRWGSLGTSGGQFNSPEGLAVDPDGNIWVADTFNSRLQKFDSNGNALGQWSKFFGDKEYNFDRPWGMTFDAAGNLYLVDRGYGPVLVFNVKSGQPNLKLTVGRSGTGDGQFNGPYSVAVDGQGNIYVPDTFNHRVQKFDRNGKFVTKWGSQGSGDGQFNNPYGVAVDGQGNVFVVDSDNRRVQKFDSNGGYQLQWGSFGTADTQFIRPAGIALDKQGNIYVAEIYNDRVQKFRQR